MARLDPLWAILSEREKRFGKWNIEDFLRTGEKEISRLMAKGTELGVPERFETAIDFGCGAGRLTRALRPHFRHCHGVDISTKMLEIASRLTRECDFRHGQDLRSFADSSADLIYSTLVLQHQPGRQDAMRLIKDMIRVLAPGGLLAFQIPIAVAFRHRIQPRRRAYRILRALGVPDSILYGKLGLSPIRMISISRRAVEEVINHAGGTILGVEELQHEPDPYTYGTFYVTRAVDCNSPVPSS